MTSEDYFSLFLSKMIIWWKLTITWTNHPTKIANSLRIIWLRDCSENFTEITQQILKWTEINVIDIVKRMCFIYIFYIFIYFYYIQFFKDNNIWFCIYYLLRISDLFSTRDMQKHEILSNLDLFWEWTLLRLAKCTRGHTHVLFYEEGSTSRRYNPYSTKRLQKYCINLTLKHCNIA